MEKIDVSSIRFTKVYGKEGMTYTVPAVFNGESISALYQEFNSITPRNFESFENMLSNTGYNGIMAMTPKGSCDQEAMEMISKSQKIELYNLNDGEYIPKISICKPESEVNCQ